MEIYKKSKKCRILHLIKYICIMSLFIQFKLQNNTIENIVNINKEIKTRDLLSASNMTNYNMVRFVDYEFLEFNTINIFRFFRKKYFNISYFKFDYNKNNNNSKLEYNFELYDEDKNLLNLKNKSKHYKFKCISKIKKLKQKTASLIDNKYYKCIEEFNASGPIQFGVQISKRRSHFNVFFNFYEVLTLNK